MTKTVYFSAVTQSENFGDWEINHQLLALLRKRSKVVVNAGAMPQEFLSYVLDGSERRVDGRFSFFLSMMWSAICGRFDGTRVYYFLNPGGFSGRGTVRSDLSHLIYVFVYLVLYILGVRIVRVGFSVDNLSPLRAFAERQKARFMYFLGPRDQGSRSFFRTLPDERCAYFPDLALQRFATGGDGESAGRKIIAFSFRRYSDPDGGEVSIKLLIDKILKSSSRDHSFAFVSQVSFDEGFNGHLASWVEREYGVEVEHFIPSEMTRLDEFYARTQIAVSNRLHVLLFAFSRGAIPIAVTRGAANAKVVGVMNDLGIASNVVDIDSEMPSLESFFAGTNVVTAHGRAVAKKQMALSLIDSVLDR